MSNTELQVPYHCHENVVIYGCELVDGTLAISCMDLVNDQEFRERWIFTDLNP